MTQLTGKVALVTGGNAGIWRSTALAFAQAGARVVIAGRRADLGEAVQQEIRSAGGDATFIPTDVSREDEVLALVQKTLHTYGRLDCAFNNAGAEGTLTPLTNAHADDVDALWNTNIKGTWLCMKHQIPVMLKLGSGAVVNMASVFGLVSLPGFSIYTASKHAVIGLTKSAALEFAQQGIRVNAVAPGPIHTDMLDRVTTGNLDQVAAMVPMGRIGTPAEVAQAVVWLCSDAASFVTGHTLTIDGGYTAR